MFFVCVCVSIKAQLTRLHSASLVELVEPCSETAAQLEHTEENVNPQGHSSEHTHTHTYPHKIPKSQGRVQPQQMLLRICLFLKCAQGVHRILTGFLTTERRRIK